VGGEWADAQITQTGNHHRCCRTWVVAPCPL